MGYDVTNVFLRRLMRFPAHKKDDSVPTMLPRHRTKCKTWILDLATVYTYKSNTSPILVAWPQSVVTNTFNCLLRDGKRANICIAKITVAKTCQEEGRRDAKQTEAKIEAFNEVDLETL